MIFRKWAIGIFGFCIVTVLFCFVLNQHYYVRFSGEGTSDPEFLTYRLDDARRLLLGPHTALIINTQQQVVVRLAPSFGRRLGPVVIWPRDARGVVLGDGVKGDVRDSYHFVERGVDIRYGDSAEKRDLHVTL